MASRKCSIQIVSEREQVGRVGLDPGLLDVQRAVAVHREVVRRPDRQVGVGGADHRAHAILIAVSVSTLACTASSSMNLPYLLSPICRNGRSSDTRM